MIDKIKNGLKKRKVKIFLVFLLCSALAWFISKLSETYVADAVFDLEYKNAPKDQMLVQASHAKIKLKLEAVGFQFFGYSFATQSVQLDLSKCQKSGKKFYLAPTVARRQIEAQLNNLMRLVEIETDTLFFDFQEVVTKTVPVKPRIELNLAQNYLLDGAILLEPDSITLVGPKNEIDSIVQVQSAKLDLTKLKADFSQKAKIIKIKELENTTYSSESVLISGKISKFSEKNITLKITAINLPKDASVRMFPDAIKVLCKGNLEVLKGLKATDFQIVADYQKVMQSDSKKMTLELRKRPDDLYSTILQKTEVEYILKRK